MKITDISAAYPDCRVYPGDPVPEVRRIRTIDRDGCNLTELDMCVHNGTHIDAPCHFMSGGADADGIPLEKCIGRCIVAGGKADLIGLADICPRIVLDGGDITAEQARAVADKLMLLGTSGLSFGESTGEQEKVHKILLGAGVVLLEGLELGGVEYGEYFLVALPLRLKGSDGSPVRAVLIK